MAVPPEEPLPPRDPWHRILLIWWIIAWLWYPAAWWGWGWHRR